MQAPQNWTSLTGSRVRFDTPLRSEHERAAAAALPAAPVAGADRPGAQRFGSIAGPRPGVEWIPYGPPADGGTPTCEVVAAHGPVELEYAALRRGAGLLDGANRGTLRIRGSDRRDFLGRMITQDLRGLEPGKAAAGFWLNRKGRIEADLLVAETGAEILVDVDVHQASATAATLAPFVVVEEVEIVDATSQFHRLVLHGPRAAAAIAQATGRPFALERFATAACEIAGEPVHAIRRDETGDPGFHLIVPTAGVLAVWRALREVGEEPPRPVGWHAFNIARIEAGTALMNIDFDTSCLPHESGILRERVSFTKGCYLGQEIVARMESLGRPRRMLVGLRIEDDVLPESGGNVHAIVDGALGEPVGTITSSAPSPMLGSAPIAFAMLRASHVAEGTRVIVTGENRRAEATVGPLRAWGRT
ncbi:MAG TPA: glycine cleavage T C-terminal barrel domain-containing protein [Phycisphaerales bacterium]|nr:glycine cleavage T C-terminal barrel domain-containing protein [Phycisphaerales bacterium]HMP37565.1 glycine cleavage T C-terminal barrel domain-containing protein [Phycisphaerales bacterium]